MEADAAEACRRFVNDAHKKRGTRVSSESVAYGNDTEESPLRQIDQRVQFHKEFALDERTGVQWILSVPIEVKYRKDVESFGIDYPPNSFLPRMPFAGDFHGSQLSRGLPLMRLDKVPLVHPVFLEITDGKTPKKVHEENLVYNAASALYDFIKFDLKEDDNGDEDHDQQIIGEMRLTDRFEKYLSEKRYAWWAVIHEWAQENLTSAITKEFNKRRGSGRVYYGLRAHVPVLCLNGSLWHYEQPAIEPCPAFLTRVRVPGWPGSLRRSLMRHTVEPPVVITNTEGLDKVLRLSLKWFGEVEAAMKLSPAPTLERWPIEAAFHRAALSKYSQDYPGTRLRSDLDIFDSL